MHDLLLVAGIIVALMLIAIILQSCYISAVQESEKAGNELIAVQHKLILALKNNLDAQRTYIKALEKKLEEEKSGTKLQNSSQDRRHQRRKRRLGN